MYRLICALMLCLAVAAAADISGTWQLAVETSQGSGTPTMELKQAGEKLTGTFNSQIMGQAKITGTVKGDAVEFERVPPPLVDSNR